MMFIICLVMILLTPTLNAYSCPTLECTDKPRDDKLCFNHEGGNPVSRISFYPCESGYICDLDYNKNDMAWVNSTQQYFGRSSNPELSAVYYKKTQAYCVNREKFKVNLLAGR